MRSLPANESCQGNRSRRSSPFSPLATRAAAARIGIATAQVYHFDALVRIIADESDGVEFDVYPLVIGT